VFTSVPLGLTIIILGAAVLIALIAWLLARLTAIRQTRRLQRDETVIAEYEAPERLTPAELGYVLDKDFQHNELLATIAQLYAKKAVKLHAAGKDFVIEATARDITELDDIESTVLGYLRSHPDRKVRWSELDTIESTVAGAESDFETATLQSLIAKGFMYDNVFNDTLLHKRIMSLIIATVCSLGLIIPLLVHALASNDAASIGQEYAKVSRGVLLMVLVPLAGAVWAMVFVYANVIAYIYYSQAGLPIGATPTLRALWPGVAGYRLFLQETEFVRLKSAPDSLDPALAYCLALGLDPGFVCSLPRTSS
jgi:hypothetical protein